MVCDITGVGAVAAIGASPAEIHRALCVGRSGRAPLRAFDASRYRARYAYEIDDRPSTGDQPGRATRWLCQVIDAALADAGLASSGADFPVLVGTTMREQRSVELWWTERQPLTLADLHFGSALAKRFGSRRTYTFANACAASLYALGLATDLIESGQEDTVVVAGTDSITESAFGMLDRVQNLVPDALRPLDKTRRGMLMGEGAVAVVLRRTGTDRQRLATVRGVSMNCDAWHATAPRAETIAGAVRQAHERARVRATDIDLVMLHGSGTDLNDSTEAAVLADVFDDARPGPWMTAIKSATGHTLGGSGLLSLVVAVFAMRTGIVPLTVGLTDPVDEAAGFRLVRGESVTADVSVAQIDAFGFGGVNAVAIVEGSR